MPPFGFIGEDRVKEFWGEGNNASETTESPIQPPTQALQAPESEANSAPPANTGAESNPPNTDATANTENKETAAEITTEEKEVPALLFPHSTPLVSDGLSATLTHVPMKHNSDNFWILNSN